MKIQLPSTQCTLRFLFLFLISQFAWGEGFRNSAPGAYGLGQSGGRYAYIDDPSAALHNPANLMDLDGESSLLFSPTIVHIESEFQVDGGNLARSEEPIKLLPSFFAVSPIVSERFVFGLSVTVPYGLATEWENAGAFGPGGELRYLTPYKSEMLTMQLNPVMAFRVTDNLTMAVGLSAMYSKLRFEQFYPDNVYVTQETVAEAEVDGWGIGANFALSWDVTEKDRLALSIRSETTIDHQGHGKIGSLSGDGYTAGATDKSDASTRITYPWILGIGYGRQLTEALTLELQYERVGFSDFEELNIDLANNTPLLGGANVTPQDWDDSETFGIALRYDHGEGLRSHASCQLFKSPVPDSTLSTTIPDADQMAYTIGLTKQWDRAYWGFAYSYVEYDRREANVGGFSGEMQVKLHLLSLNMGWRF
ncbi:MAG: hypothetical protein CML13_16995 [Puniceicoccaceae bacterium]|nr:hypothetical protein [Puniceicoccaceae bacterium]|tara:strand:+ start:4692 stop:5957 length:1266 start_codon:yes stop_codon:yes gene_type:complete